MDKNKRIEILKALAMFTQFGLQIFLPVACCIILAGWVQRTYQAGNWVTIIGIVLGVGAGVSNLMSILRKWNKK